MLREPVSVVIAAYNRAALLPQTVRSVAYALAADDEIVLVDDGSTDDTGKVVRALRRELGVSLHYVWHEHLGAGRAFNAGIAAAHHDLVAFCDSDDMWLPWRLALERPVMATHRELVYCFADFAHEEADGTREAHWVAQWSGDARPWDEILGPGREYAGRWPVPVSLPERDRRLRVHIGSMYLNQLQTNYMSVNTLLVRRSRAGGALKFGEDLPRLADWECFARIAAAGPGAFLGADVAVQRAHGGDRLSNQGRLQYLEARIEVIQRTFARDEAFMGRHGAEVSALLETLRREALRAMIRESRLEDARRMLPSVRGAYLERIVLLLPPAIVALIVELLELIS
jgi:glycosyltransferase involved in cell wall biosynthesis